MKVLPFLRTKYFSWRDYATLKRLNGAKLYTQEDLVRATELYLEPDCQSIDPSGLEDFRKTVPVRQSAHKALLSLLEPHSGQRFCILFADSGMGKTTVFLNFYARYGRRKNGRYQIMIVPLGDPRADSLITEVPNKTRTVLLLDAFDEDTKAISDYKARLADLMELSKDFSHVLISCRTQFFEKDAEIPQDTGVLRIGAIKAGQSRTYTLYKIYLSPFSQEQVAKYIALRFPVWKIKERRKARQVVGSIKDLSARPMLLAHVSDLVKSADHPTDLTQTYASIVDAWLLRESHFVEPSTLLSFSKLAAIDIYSRREERGGEKMPRVEAIALAKRHGLSLDDWQLGGRSLLNRDGEGQLKFSHRTLMEYLFIRAFIEGVVGISRSTWTDQMKRFWAEEVQDRYMRGLMANDENARNFIGDLAHAREYGDVSGFLRLGIVFYVSQVKERALEYGPMLFESIEVVDRTRAAQPVLRYLVDFVNRVVWEVASEIALNSAEIESRLRKLNSRFPSRSGGWRLPTSSEAAGLAPRSPGEDAYPRSLFTTWADRLWVSDATRDEGPILRCLRFDSEGSPVIEDVSDSYGPVLIRCVKDYISFRYDEYLLDRDLDELH